MAIPWIVALPPNLELWDGCIIRIQATSPTTGNPVTGVAISDIAFEVDTDDESDLAYGPFMLVTGPEG